VIMVVYGHLGVVSGITIEAEQKSRGGVQHVIAANACASL
jgi:hypothetical protein